MLAPGAAKRVVAISVIGLRPGYGIPGSVARVAAGMALRCCGRWLGIARGTVGVPGRGLKGRQRTTGLAGDGRVGGPGLPRDTLTVHSSDSIPMLDRRVPTTARA